MDLKSDPTNARRHTERNRKLIRQSLEELGPFRSIAIDGNDIVRAGNGVYEQAQELGLKIRVVEAAPDELIAVKRADLTGEAAERAAIYDNQTSELSEWDVQMIASLAENKPLVLEGIFEGGEVMAMIEEASEMDQVEGSLRKTTDAEAVGRNRLGDESTKIRSVIYARDIQTFERALRSTGLENRGQALMEICKYYLERKNG